MLLYGDFSGFLCFRGMGNIPLPIQSLSRQLLYNPRPSLPGSDASQRWRLWALFLIHVDVLVLGGRVTSDFTLDVLAVLLGALYPT